MNTTSTMNVDDDDDLSFCSLEAGDLDETEAADEATDLLLSASQSQGVRLSKVGVFSVLVLVAIALGAFAYKLANQDSSLGAGQASLVASLVVFLPLAAAFCAHDWVVDRRHNKVLKLAKQNNAIVSSFFPGTLHDRILHDVEEQKKGVENGSTRRQSWKGYKAAPMAKLKNFLHQEATTRGGQASSELVESSPTSTGGSVPIAEFFPEVTILFADICGFTSWSSVREPSQVFELLETVFRTFDGIAKRRRVFKVETVGDCYVAAAGLPDPRPDHAIVMARFARDCSLQFQALTQQLEVSLGMGTSDLSIRVGLHSGPVTAGVLRGDKSRFQLFGDTMNSCARIESTGAPNQIHISKETAERLMAAGKAHWLRERKDKVLAKGKGMLQTYWLEMRAKRGSMTSDGANSLGSTDSGHFREDDAATCFETAIADQLIDTKDQRLIHWHVDKILRLLRELAARREALDLDNPGRRPLDTEHKLQELESLNPRRGSAIIEEVQEVVVLPRFNAIADKYQKDPDSVKLSDAVLEQVRDYVKTIASMYRKENPFHNFEHASHVTMSTNKLLSRIVAPDLTHTNSRSNTDLAYKSLHDHTYGITTDPLTRFACMFSSLIHDVDHAGVPNTQLVKEAVPIAQLYNNRSVAEQNSIDVAWSLLMSDRYKDFRRTIYSSVTGFHRFRSLTVNATMATDVMDKDLKAIRNGRWDKAFSEQVSDAESETDNVNRKATIVIEHLIQASDVSHTMQHWHVFIKWNESLFKEMYKAYKEGHSESDPSKFWYKGEISFFDFYVIPLAKKLKACGVFGVSSDEYLNYATENRNEWEARGQELVSLYLENFAREDKLIRREATRRASIGEMA